MKKQIIRISRWSWFLIVTWTVVLISSYLWNIHQLQSLLLEQARSELRTHFFKNQTFRLWATNHGGVYVPVSDTQQPDPYIDFLPERDVVTPSGRVLTLINPALMMRQFNELAREKFAFEGHTSGIKPLNPVNAADAWEQQAYRQFAQGEKEVTAITTLHGKPYLRLMQPVVMSAPCLKCHAQQGYGEGELAGGNSVAVPLPPLEILADERMSTLKDGHSLIWLLGLLGILIGKRQLALQIDQREQAQERIERDFISQQLIAGVLETSLEPVGFERRLERVLQQILAIPWLRLQAKGAIFIRKEDETLEMVAGHGLSLEVLTRCASIKFGECLCGQAAQRREVLYKGGVDVDHHHRFSDMAPHGHYCLPIQSGTQLLGVISLYLDHNHPRDEDELALLATVSHTVGGMIQRHQAEQRLLHSAYHDALTDMPNRLLFSEHLQQRMTRFERNPESPFAVLLLDLDRFKLINDSLGHAVGDKLLVEVANRLKECIRPVDTVARLGGDEFIVLLEDVHAESEVQHIAERIYAILRDPIELDALELYAPCSIGIALAHPRYQHAEALIRDADIAMYRAKTLGARHIVFFDQAMHCSALERLTMETALLRDFENNKLQVYYQPIIAAQSGQIAGVEALVRWPQADGSMLSPAVFIPLAEETGLINAIGLWVLREACREVLKWQASLPAYRDLYLSVNLSGKQLLQADLFELIETIVQGTNYPPEKLRLELTESTLMVDSQSNTLLLERFRDRGYRFYIDDFGTGYSSLSYLHNFPFDALKIDRSFVHNLQDGDGHRKMIETIISIAHNFNMKVVAEGIETAPQLELLTALGCEYLQGYLLSPPLPGAELLTLLSNRDYRH